MESRYPLSRNRWIFPVAVLAKSSTKTTTWGTDTADERSCTTAEGYELFGSARWTRIRAQGLIHAVRAVTHGEVYVTPALASGILHEMTREEPVDPFQRLTPREHDILELVAQGHTNREIGEHLYLAEKTVKHYMTNVLQKLHVRSRVEAALLAQRRELEGK